MGIFPEDEGTALFHRNKELDEQLSVADIKYKMGDIIEINKMEIIEKQAMKSSKDEGHKKSRKKRSKKKKLEDR